jgi:hypothetical protein
VQWFKLLTLLADLLGYVSQHKPICLHKNQYTAHGVVALTVDAVSASETSVSLYSTAPRNIPEHSAQENLKSHIPHCTQTTQNPY